MARAVLENHGNEAYFETHPVADELRRSYGTGRLEQLATAKTFDGGCKLFGMSVDSRNPKAARWP